ncbi:MULTISPECIES: hypothetical protein [Mycobacteriaceae]|uniref:hypothetical protein n=1 Tax=Mycobacteriaceae TaxID=1762 RepID=UPI0007FDC493|nr:MULTISPECIES: hypothetical protein [Mycobacteriaceae]MCK0174543.1 hypothetical protein [Mycolicibacterium sp. F2034L]OBB59069.1 hypothetical protein A5757_01195 [Mycobacterium sp. 852013-51886_SCH5428379]
MYEHPRDVRSDHAQLRDVVRYTLGVAVLGAAFLFVAAVWVSTCGGTVADPLACGVPQRTLLGLGAPAILLAGAARAFARTLQHRRRGDTWTAWQASGWVLLTLMLVVIAASMPPLAGPAVFG